MNVGDFKISEKYDVTVNDLLRYLSRPPGYRKTIKKQKDTDGAVMAAAIGGFATGFIAAILLSPESGKKFRGEIGETLKEASKKLAEFTESEAAKVKAYVNER